MVHFFLQRKKSAKSVTLRNHYKKVYDSNPYLNEIINLRKTIPEWDNFFNDESEENRDTNWVRLEVLGQPLSEKFAWAIPEERSLNILTEFSPLIEIGAGKGYWASLLREREVDIVAYDIFVDEENSHTEVLVGGPKMLKKKANQGRNLFLCYPDEAQDMSVECLEHFKGEYIIHVGELLVTGTLSGGLQAPFGRTTSSEFNVLLHETFHCLLTASLPRFPFSNDCISVWKRTEFVSGRPVNDEDEDSVPEDGDSEKSQNGSEEQDEEDVNLWANIPSNERMPQDRAAPCLEHLLR